MNSLFGMTNVTMQQISAFLNVAEYLNMTNAADAMHVTQPLLSQRIAALENEIKVQLFVRRKRNLQLTPAGKYLQKQWTDLFAEIEESINVARNIQKEQSKSINISFCFGIPSKITIEIMRKLSAEFPSHYFTFQQMNIYQIMSELIEQRTDLAIAPNYNMDYRDGMVHFVTILECNLKVIVGKTHPLAKKQYVTWDDIKGCKILCEIASKSGGYEKQIRSLCMEHGFVPDLVTCNNSISTFTKMVLGEGILLVALPTIHDLSDDCKKFILEDSQIPITLSYLESNNSEEFLQVVDRIRNLIYHILKDSEDFYDGMVQNR